jgi:isocitrate lyase
MTAYADLQEAEFKAREQGFRAVEHQAFVGTAYFDAVQEAIMGGQASTLAMHGSTEAEQF